MALHQLNFSGKDKVDVALDRIKTFEPPEGYYLAFSGGKDSVVCKALCDMAGVRYDAHYNITTVDPPELVQFIKTFDDVIMEHSYWEEDGLYHKAGDPITMWNLIPEKLMPPTRTVRYCCQYLKERGGEGRFVITGVRHAESNARRSRGGALEWSDKKSGKREFIDPDNPSQEMIHVCQMKRQRILNPIIDWEEDDVWEFIHEYNVPYCKLYDTGLKRLGCIGCPITRGAWKELERYPKVKRAYMKAFSRMLEARKQKGKESEWTTPEEVMEWYLKR